MQIFNGTSLNFAHRGFTRSAPENSLSAFAAAIELGVDGIELDVRTCKTGEVIVFHDPTVARMTNGRGFVKNKTLEELKRLRLRNQNLEINENIPTLEEVIELLDGRVILNIELKTKGTRKESLEKKVVDIIGYYGIADSTVISSFNPIAVRRIRKIDDRLTTGLILNKNFNIRRSEIPLTKLVGAKALHLEKSLVRAKLIKKIKDLGFYCVVWSENDPGKMQQMIDIGIDAIITDKPDVLKNVKAGLVHE